MCIWGEYRDAVFNESILEPRHSTLKLGKNHLLIQLQKYGTKLNPLVRLWDHFEFILLLYIYFEYFCSH